MTASIPPEQPVPKRRHDDDEISLLALASVLLRWRRTIIISALAGAIFGACSGLTATRMYVSSAIFVPQEAQPASGVALAASQLGISLPNNSGSWGPPMYVELIHSPTLLEAIARDTITVAERGNRRVPVLQLLKIEAPTDAQRMDQAVRALATVVRVGEVKPIAAVKVSVISQWPSVSLGLADKVVKGINRFNLETRKSQAAAERQFVEEQSGEAERALRASEDRLQNFLQQNRDLAGSPQLTFERDRMQRDVTLRQSIYNSLLQSREEAKIREVRDIPVITLLESPRLAVLGEPRGTVQKTIIGGMTGFMIAVVLAFLSNALMGARIEPSDAAREFFQVVDEATPKFVKRLKR